MTTSSSPSFLDRPVARLLAVGVAAASVALLLYINRADFLPGSEEVASVEDNAYQACVDERHGQIDDMVREGLVGESQAGLFKSRAEALCRATAEGQ